MSIENKGTSVFDAFGNLKSIDHVDLDDLYINALNLKKSHKISDSDFDNISNSISSIAKLIGSKQKEAYIVRKARLSDVDALYEMVKFWAQKGENLPRPKEDLRRNIQTFAVCVKDNEILGCACLYVYDSGLAEIRSLGVSPNIQRQGQGRSIVEFLLKKAYDMEIKKVFVLTRAPHFFSRVGFIATSIDALPEKILKDCEKCPKRDRCDEVAYEYNFNFQKD